MLEHDNTLIKSPSHIPPLNHPAAYSARWKRVFNSSIDSDLVEV